MFNTPSGYSLSDIAAATTNKENDGFFGGNNGWWIILLFLFAGWGGNGFGGNCGQGTLREEISYGFDMNGLENGIRGVQQGLCDGFYAMNTGMLNGFNGVQSTLCQGFSGVNDAITRSTIADMQSDFGLQTAIGNSTTSITSQLTGLSGQMADCCCSTKTAIEKGFSDLNYNLATQSCDTRRAICDSTRDIIDSNNAGVRSILDFLTQDKIATLTAENQSLKFAASQAAQNAYLVSALRDPSPVPAYVVPNPSCCYDSRVFGCCNSFCG